MEWKRLLMAQDETSTVNASTRKNGAEINGSKVNGSNTTLEEDPVATIVVDGKPTLNTTFAQTFAITSTVSENATSLVSTGLSRDSSISSIPTSSSSSDTKNGITTKLASLSKRLRTWRRRRNVTGTLSNQNNNYDNHIPFISLPDGRSTVELMRLAGSIFFVIMAKVICYASLTLKATNFGVVQLATYNIMMRVFFFHARVLEIHLRKEHNRIYRRPCCKRTIPMSSKY